MKTLNKRGLILELILVALPFVEIIIYINRYDKQLWTNFIALKWNK